MVFFFSIFSISLVSEHVKLKPISLQHSLDNVHSSNSNKFIYCYINNLVPEITHACLTVSFYLKSPIMCRPFLGPENSVFCLTEYPS